MSVTQAFGPFFPTLYIVYVPCSGVVVALAGTALIPIILKPGEHYFNLFCSCQFLGIAQGPVSMSFLSRR